MDTNGSPRRSWPDAEVVKILANYEKLPRQTGARRAWLEQRGLSTAQMSIWRRKRRLPGSTAKVAIQEGVVAVSALPPLTIVDGPDVSAVIAGLLAQKEACALRVAQIERAVAALCELEVQKRASA